MRFPIDANINRGRGIVESDEIGRRNRFGNMLECYIHAFSRERLATRKASMANHANC